MMRYTLYWAPIAAVPSFEVLLSYQFGMVWVRYTLEDISLTIFFMMFTFIYLDIVIIIYEPFIPQSKRLKYYRFFTAAVLLLMPLSLTIRSKSGGMHIMDHDFKAKLLDIGGLISLPIQIILLFILTCKLYCTHKPNKKLRTAILWRYFAISIVSILYSAFNAL